ncbi:MAG: phospho-sugar mutase [Opitutales bacterium]|nr:phospho-sugar mutase [Opitutales bacterium]
MNKIEELKKLVSTAKAEGKILDSAVENIENWLSKNFLPDWAINALFELFENQAYEELNDRFFKPLAFGTGGMRGRTIGKVSAKAELGTLSDKGTPEHAAVGANNMNDFNVARATKGLFNYCKKYCDANGSGVPKLVVACDVRHFSTHFCELTASVLKKLGGEVSIFDSPRSTPQLSFTVRYLKATAGIVITASHNPSHDNGYKVYFSDGAQVISPHAEGIVAEVNNVEWESVGELLDIDLNGVKYVEKSAEDAYVKSIEDCVIDKDVMAVNKPKLVFTAVHGTGASLCPSVMRHFGLEPVLVEEQMQMDPRFPTVKQPNPEYAETLSMGIAKMNESGADCLMATDPDADRMGVAIRTRDGEIRILTGNMIGSLLAEYRATQMKEKGIIVDSSKCAFIKTFVTTPLQDKIAEVHGIKCVNTLTGFKWIGGRLTKYEEELVKNYGNDASDMNYADKARLMQKYSTFFVFGGEESYGYLGTDSVRDKDANSAVIMFSEMLAYLKSKGMTVDEYLDSIYVKCGYYLEDLRSIYREGALGSAQIQGFLTMLDENPLTEVAGVKVAKSINFNRDEIFDADGIKIPREKFFFYTLENGYSFAVRGSGTEPKIKFYAFATEKVSDKEQLADAKLQARKNLDSLLDGLAEKFEQSTK